MGLVSAHSVKRQAEALRVFHEEARSAEARERAHERARSWNRPALRARVKRRARTEALTLRAIGFRERNRPALVLVTLCALPLTLALSGFGAALALVALAALAGIVEL